MLDLDDGHYTLRTWAEVTGISLKDMRAMLIEFSSNMRYHMMVSPDEWRDWTQEIRAHLSILSAESSSEAIDAHDVAPSAQNVFIPADQDFLDDMRPRDISISKSPPALTRASELAGKTPRAIPGSACRLASPPAILNPGGPLSPSRFFSPVVHSWWPSFMTQQSTLDTTNLIREQAELYSNEIPEEDLQWIDVAARDAKVHQGHISLTDEYFDALDPSIVW